MCIRDRSEASTYGATDAVQDPNNKRCFVANLRKVEGTKAIGGFAGQIDPASAAALDTAAVSYTHLQPSYGRDVI